MIHLIKRKDLVVQGFSTFIIRNNFCKIKTPIWRLKFLHPIISSLFFDYQQFRSSSSYDISSLIWWKMKWGFQPSKCFSILLPPTFRVEIPTFCYFFCYFQIILVSISKWAILTTASFGSFVSKLLPMTPFDSYWVFSPS